MKSSYAQIEFSVKAHLTRLAESDVPLEYIGCLPYRILDLKRLGKREYRETI
jgi:hypothetical protein